MTVSDDFTAFLSVFYFKNFAINTRVRGVAVGGMSSKGDEQLCKHVCAKPRRFFIGWIDEPNILKTFLSTLDVPRSESSLILQIDFKKNIVKKKPREKRFVERFFSFRTVGNRHTRYNRTNVDFQRSIGNRIIFWKRRM